METKIASFKRGYMQKTLNTIFVRYIFLYGELSLQVQSLRKE